MCQTLLRNLRNVFAKCLGFITKCVDFTTKRVRFTTCVDYETRQNAIGFIKIVINKLKKRYLSEVQEKHELLVNTDIANNLSFKVIYKNFGGAVLYKSVLIYI